jgi:hypothetical protein
VLGELDGPDSLHSRTRARLGRMEKSLAKWNEQGAHKAAVAAIREKMNGICGSLPKGDTARENCTGFLAKA